MNRRAGGGSDEEIAKLPLVAREATQVKLSEVKEEVPTYNLTEDDKIRIVEWLTDEKQWPNMRIKQALFWTTVCHCNGRVRAEGLGGERGQAGTRVITESEG